MITIYNSKAIREQIADKAAAADALVALAEQEERDLTAEEKTTFDNIIAEIGEEEANTGLYADLSQALKFEKIKAGLSKPAGTSTPDPRTSDDASRIVAVGPAWEGGLKSFTGKDAGKRAYDCGQWFSAIYGNAEAREYCNNNNIPIIKAAQTGSSDAAGGYTVPNIVSSTVWDVAALFGAIRRLANITPMTSDTLNIPKRAGGLTVQYPNQAAATTLSDKTWGQVALSVVKRATLTKVARELINDSVINVIDDLIQEIGRAIGTATDNEGINGDASATYGGESGLEDQGSLPSITGAGNTFEELTLANFTSVIGQLPEKHHSNASWLMSRTGYAQSAERLLYAAGGNTTMQLEGGAMRRQIFGYPVEFSDQMPAEANSATAAYFGDFRAGMYIGQREDVEVRTSDDYAFNEDVTTVRGTARYDIDVHEAGAAGAFVKLSLAAS